MLLKPLRYKTNDQHRGTVLAMGSLRDKLLMMAKHRQVPAVIIVIVIFDQHYSNIVVITVLSGTILITPSFDIQNNASCRSIRAHRGRPLVFAV